MFHGVRVRYALDAPRAREILSTAKIFHPYGMVAPHPEIANGGTGFGNTMNLAWKQMSNQIRTFTEEMTDTDQLGRMRDEIARAGTLVFLGFGFHKQNIALLAEQNSLGTKRIFGSAFGVSNADLKVVKSRILPLFKQNDQGPLVHGSTAMKMDKLKCSPLMDEYKMTLTA